jgi:hypothetical protein
MNDDQVKGLSVSDSSAPQTSVFGREETASLTPQTRTEQTPTERAEQHCGSTCHQEVKTFATRLRKLFADEIAAEPRGFKKRVIEILKRSLPPFAGRPTEDSITIAIQLRAEGRSWPEVYSQVIVNHDKLDTANRRLAELNLRSALRARRNARKRVDRAIGDRGHNARDRGSTGRQGGGDATSN